MFTAFIRVRKRSEQERRGPRLLDGFIRSDSAFGLSCSAPARRFSACDVRVNGQPMTEAAKKNLMTVDEFLAWSEGREGRFELYAGEIVEKSPERPEHAQTREAAASAFKAAIRRAGAHCHVAPDGAAVRIATDTALDPDLIVYWGDRPPPDTVEIRDPVVVVEVMSEATAARDQGLKATSYFAPPSVAHYIVLDPERRAATHRWRGAQGAIETRVVTEGPLALDPPGLALFVEEFFPPH